MRYRTLNSIASDLCALHLGDPAGQKMGLAVRALRNSLDELNMSVLPNVVSGMMEIADDFTIMMPGDCIQVTKVGVILEDNGIVRFMGRMDNVRRAVESNCCVCDETPTEETVTANISLGNTIHNVFYTSTRKGELYGYRLPQFPNGMFRYNRGENRIEFSSGYDIVVGNKVLVEYLSSLSGEGYNMIPSELANAIMYHSAMSLNLSSRPGIAKNYMNEFLRSFGEYKTIALSYDIPDLVAALRGESMSAPKY